VQGDPIKPTLKTLGSRDLKLNMICCFRICFQFAFIFNLRRYTKAPNSETHGTAGTRNCEMEPLRASESNQQTRRRKSVDGDGGSRSPRSPRSPKGTTGRGGGGGGGQAASSSGGGGGSESVGGGGGGGGGGSWSPSKEGGGGGEVEPTMRELFGTFRFCSVCMSGRAFQSFPFQLNLSWFVHESTDSSLAGAYVQLQRERSEDPWCTLVHFSAQPRPFLVTDPLKPPRVSLKGAYVELKSGRVYAPDVGHVSQRAVRVPGSHLLGPRRACRVGQARGYTLRDHGRAVRVEPEFKPG